MGVGDVLDHATCWGATGSRGRVRPTGACAAVRTFTPMSGPGRGRTRDVRDGVRVPAEGGGRTRGAPAEGPWIHLMGEGRSAAAGTGQR